LLFCEATPVVPHGSFYRHGRKEEEEEEEEEEHDVGS
jgi:hypothetical protein